MDKADKMLQIALKQAQNIGHEEAVTHIFSLMANLALERRLYSQAEALFTKVLQRLVSGGEPQDSNAVVEISLKIAQIFHRNGETAKAEQGLLFCVTSQRRKLAGGQEDEDTKALLGIALDMQGQFLLSQGRFKEAELCWREAGDVARQVLGEEEEQVLVVTNSLATVLSMTGREEEAGKTLEAVVSTAERINSDHLPTFLVNLGLVRLKQGLAEQAGRHCERARRSAETAGDTGTVRQAEDCLHQLEAVLSGQAT